MATKFISCALGDEVHRFVLYEGKPPVFKLR